VSGALRCLWDACQQASQPALSAMTSGWHVFSPIGMSAASGTHASRLRSLHCRHRHQDGMGLLVGPWCTPHGTAAGRHNHWHSRPCLAICSVFLTAPIGGSANAYGCHVSGLSLHCRQRYQDGMTSLDTTGSADCCGVHVSGPCSPHCQQWHQDDVSPQLDLIFVSFVFNLGAVTSRGT
jgi:hypothetical protein